MEKMTLKNMLENSAEKYASRPALTDVGGYPFTYEKVYNKVQQLIEYLKEQRITAENKVALLGVNCPNWGIAYLAITTMGAVVVPILPDFRSNEIHHIIRHSGSKAIFISKSIYEKEENDFDENLKVIALDDFKEIETEKERNVIDEIVDKGSKEFSKIKNAAIELSGISKDEIDENDIASIVYTSGTTGHSKGVMLSHKNLVFDILATLKIQPVNSTDRFLSILPLSHTYEGTIGFLIPMMQGACVYYLNKPPTPKVLLNAMAKVRPTMMLTVPLIIEKIYRSKILPQLSGGKLKNKLFKVPAIRKKLHKIAGKKLYKSFGGEIHFFGIGGALLAPDVERFLRDANFPYSIGYGLTETSPLIAGTGPSWSRYRSTGPAIPGVEVKIDNPDPKTGEGEILVRGDNVMLGYYNDPEQTKEVFTEDGFFKTGDLGMLDSDNYIFIKGRLKNIIVGPSGENIYPEQIETTINEKESVVESLVFLENGQLTARIHLDYEELDKQFAARKLSEGQIQIEISKMLDNLKIQVNEEVNLFSRINRVIEQTEPFEKTPTKKIKRFLYVN
jgi:long-chain acyl-CoA synthetase